MIEMLKNCLWPGIGCCCCCVNCFFLFSSVITFRPSTYFAGFADVCLGQALLGAVYVVCPSLAVADVQQVSSHVILRGGDLCCKETKVRDLKYTWHTWLLSRSTSLLTMAVDVCSLSCYNVRLILTWDCLHADILGSSTYFWCDWWRKPWDFP